MAASGHFGCSKITFDLISGHFRSIRNFFFEIFDKMAAAIFGCPKFTLDSHISGHFRSLQIFIFVLNFFYKWLPVAILIDTQLYFCLKFFDKMADVGHFGCPNLTFDRISGHFRSIRNFNFFGIF